MSIVNQHACCHSAPFWQQLDHLVYLKITLLLVQLGQLALRCHVFRLPLFLPTLDLSCLDLVLVTFIKLQ